MRAAVMVMMLTGSGLRRSAADKAFCLGDLHLAGVALGVALGPWRRLRNRGGVLFAARNPGGAYLN